MKMKVLIFLLLCTAGNLFGARGIMCGYECFDSWDPDGDEHCVYMNQTNNHNSCMLLRVGGQFVCRQLWCV